MAELSAFLSYTRKDDETVGGLITSLKDVLERHVEYVTGQPIDIFLDTDDIGLGQDWRQRLESAIQEARFFIPVITPRYFNSRPCTFEMSRFHALEQAARRNDLILPIYLQTADIVEELQKADDARKLELAKENPLASIIEQRNYADWRGLFPKTLDSEKGKLLVHDLALKIKVAIANVPKLPAAAMPLQNRIDELMRRIAELEGDRDKAAGLTAEKIKSLEAALAAKTVELKGLREDAASFRSEAEIRLTNEIAGHQAEIARLSGELAQKAEALKVSQQLNAYNKRQIEELKGSLAALSNKNPKDVLFQSGSTLLNPGDIFRDCNDYPEMVVVPAGEFMMGSPDDEKGRSSAEGPQHLVRIARDFAVGRFPVTFAQWDACVSAGGCTHRPNDRGWGRNDRPVINVSWKDAQAYVRWLREMTGEDYRLLSEAEWEYAARAGSNSRYSWGDNIGVNRAKCDGQKTAPVGQFEANAFGLFDMHGNVWEWVEDCWNDSYNGAPIDGSAWLEGNCDRRVVRGGSWNFKPDLRRSANRGRNHSGNRLNRYGFRVARTLH